MLTVVLDLIELQDVGLVLWGRIKMTNNLVHFNLFEVEIKALYFRISYHICELLQIVQ